MACLASVCVCVCVLCVCIVHLVVSLHYTRSLKDSAAAALSKACYDVAIDHEPMLQPLRSPICMVNFSVSI